MATFQAIQGYNNNQLFLNFVFKMIFQILMYVISSLKEPQVFPFHNAFKKLHLLKLIIIVDIMYPKSILY